MRSFTLQDRHQSAVKSMNMGRPSALRATTHSGENASHSTPPGEGADAANGSRATHGVELDYTIWPSNEAVRDALRAAIAR